MCTSVLSSLGYILLAACGRQMIESEKGAPQVGLRFKNLDEAWQFWVAYGGRMGFDVRKRYKKSWIDELQKRKPKPAKSTKQTKKAAKVFVPLNLHTLTCYCHSFIK